MYENNQPVFVVSIGFCPLAKNILDLELGERKGLPPDDRHRETCGHQFTSHHSMSNKRKFDLRTENETLPLKVGVPIE